MSAVYADDSERSLDSVLSYLVGRRLTLHELLDALQMSRTRYYRLRDEGRLTEPNCLVTAAVNLGINTVELLARYGHVSGGEVLQYADQLTAPARTGPAAGTAVAVHAGLMPAAGTRNRLSTLMPRPGAPRL